MPTGYFETTVDKFTFRVAPDRVYSPEGIWVQDLGSGCVRIGVTDFVQQHSGDVAFATVREAGTVLRAGEDFAELETVKVNLPLPSPVAGTLLEANPVVQTTAELINEEPYDRGWLAVVQASAWDADRTALLDPAAYLSVMQVEARQEAERT